MKQNGFARGLNFYKLFWVFLVFSIFGWAVEMLFVPIAHHGLWESRNGLLYGPISQIYGIGAILVVLLFNRFATLPNSRGVPLIFVGGMAAGSGFEWIASIVQQKVFGTISWDYSGLPGAIGVGRINVLFTVFWGIAALLIIKVLYPVVSSWIERIPDNIGKPLTIVLCIILVVDMLLTVAAVGRWQERNRGVPAHTHFEVILDERYPDAYMKETFPNMKLATQRNGSEKHSTK